jgi:hypothetical protein
MSIRLFVSKFISENTTYIGSVGDIFWNYQNNTLRRSDGQTPGGLLAIPEPVFPQIAFMNYFDFDSQSVTTFDQTNTWKLLNCTTTTSFSRNGFVHTNNRITNVGSPKIVKMEGIASLESQDGNLEIHMAFFKDGVIVPCSEQSVFTFTRGNTEYASAVPFHCITDLPTGSFIEVYVKNSTNTNSIKLQNINVILTEL